MPRKNNSSLKQFNLKVLDSVYAPREDSFLLGKCINDIIQKKVKRKKALDLGCGTGIQSINLALKGFEVTAFDLNSTAIKNTKLNAKIAGMQKKVKARKSDLFAKTKDKFDFIVFNAPYLASDKIKDLSIDGGGKGRAILDRFLEKLPEYLKDNGLCLFVQNDLNGEEETKRILEKLELENKVIARQKLFFEELMVFKCWKKRTEKTKQKTSRTQKTQK